MFLFPFDFVFLSIDVSVCKCTVSLKYKRKEMWRLSDDARTMYALNLLNDVLYHMCQPNPEICLSYYRNERPISMNLLRHNG